MKVSTKFDNASGTRVQTVQPDKSYKLSDIACSSSCSYMLL